MEYLFLLGRVLFGGYFVLNGFNHFKNVGALTGYAQSKGVPMAKWGVLISGAMIFLGGLGVLLGYRIPCSVFLISVFLVLVTFKMHAFWNISDPMMRMGEEVNFKKNLALLGATLMLLAIPTPWVLSLVM
jgi:uncharacterized membrane protein YphA (DoxX/SURF4 family)